MRCTTTYCVPARSAQVCCWTRDSGTRVAGTTVIATAPAAQRVLCSAPTRCFVLGRTAVRGLHVYCIALRGLYCCRELYPQQNKANKRDWLPRRSCTHPTLRRTIPPPPWLFTRRVGAGGDMWRLWWSGWRCSPAVDHANKFGASVLSSRAVAGLHVP